jgi:hypothetical protein
MQGQNPSHNLIRRLQSLGPASHESVADQEALEGPRLLYAGRTTLPLHACRCALLNAN